MKATEKRLHSRESRLAYIFNAPMIILAAVFILLPVIGTIITSFHKDVTFLSERALSFQNYARLFSDGHFWQSTLFTMMFVVVSVALELIIGIIFALLLQETFRGRGIMRVVLLIPWAIPIAISARVWELIYNYEYGVLNYLITSAGIVSAPVNWLGTAVSAFIAIVISDVWKTTPFIAIILMAGLSAIPEDLYKQAMIDGTNFLQRFARITLPILKPVIVVALLFRTIDAIRIFDLVYVLTGGGPGGSTTSLSLYAYRYYLTGDFGYGSAVSVVVFIIALGLAFVYIKFGKFAESVK